MTEYRFVSFRRAASSVVPTTANDVSVLTIDFAGSMPELGESMDGWEAVNFQVTPLAGEEVLLTLLMRTEVDPEGLLTPPE